LPAQGNVISKLHNQNDLRIYQTTKKIGPSVADQSTYLCDIIETHLLNANNYGFLTNADATTALQEQCSNFLEIYGELGHLLPTEAKSTYFK
jgi:hypothetical protein